MSVKEMDAAYKQALESNRHEPTNYKNSSHKDGVFEVLQSLRKNEKFCDIKLQTDDGKIIFGHKNILVSASPYFNAMFSNFNESNKDLVNIRKLDFHILQLLIDYIYTGEIIVTEKHVQGLLPAANLLQLEYVTSACADFLITQLDPSNCLGIQRFADVHNCVELLISSEAYIKKQFLEVVQFDEFLSLSSEEVIKLISCDDLFVPLEEKKRFFAQSDGTCKDYVFEALQFYVLKSVYPFTIPQTIRSTPRKSGGLQKIVLALSYSSAMQKSFTNWFDPFINLWQIAPGMTKSRNKAGLGVIKDTFVLALGDVINSSSQSVEMLDLSSQSPCWVQIVDMLVSRQHLGVGILNDSIYAVGGHDGTSYLNSVEVFDVSIQKWKMVSSMSIRRSHFGVGVLNNLLYAVLMGQY
ncbi:ring canal kelch homolog [Acyrthosiphon pisum]|uniref:BTB domain-containing protein n=1 Tax=Acyrthosiphon pisum TaxID=7029 RepID=A0A8R2JM66_ACYPI|nr:ring canal kelch homolog [Acyrthosiphon pisum]